MSGGSNSSSWIKELLAVLLGGVIAGATSYYVAQQNARVETRSQDIQMVQIALSILKGDNEDQKGLQAPTFAIELLKRYSGLLEAKDMTGSDVDWEAWLKNGTVPFSPFGRSWTDSIDFTEPIVWGPPSSSASEASSSVAR